MAVMVEIPLERAQQMRDALALAKELLDKMNLCDCSGEIVAFQQSLRIALERL